MIMAAHNEDGHLNLICFALTAVVAIISFFLLFAWICAIIQYSERFMVEFGELSIIRDGIPLLAKTAYFGLLLALIGFTLELFDGLLGQAGTALLSSGSFILALCGGTCLILVIFKKLGLEPLITNHRKPKKRKPHKKVFPD